VEKEIDCFETISVLNRLGMEINIDVAAALIEDGLTLIVRANGEYHRSTVSKNIEQIAFQLKQRFTEKDEPLSVVEYTQPSHKTSSHKSVKTEWWQWRFNWVGNTPLDAQRHALSSFAVRTINVEMMRLPETLKAS